jgi:DNA-binding transcriptional ArsR family regulator
LPRSPEAAAERLDSLEAVASALAHRARRQILLVMHFRGGEMTAGEIADRFSCSWPTVTRHLRVLERAGLLVPEKRGRNRYYRLQSENLAVVREWLSWFDSKKGRKTP